MLSPVKQEQEDEKFVPLSEINKKNKIKQTYKNLSNDVKITNDNCFYFY